jgi:uncharacterized protein with FMN-binding domain
MRRFSLALSGAVVGLVGLVGYRAVTPSLPSFAIAPSTVQRSTAITSPGVATTTAPPTTVPITSTSSPVRTTPSTPTSTPPTTATVAPTTTTAPSTTLRSATGGSVNYIYGILSVDVTVTGSKIVKVTIASLNDGGNYRSQSIDQMAIPQLEQEAITAQSANIQGVSGASYTSAGFSQSLQSALGKLGL